MGCGPDGAIHASLLVRCVGRARARAVASGVSQRQPHEGFGNTRKTKRKCTVQTVEQHTERMQSADQGACVWQSQSDTSELSVGLGIMAALCHVAEPAGSPCSQISGSLSVGIER